MATDPNKYELSKADCVAIVNRHPDLRDRLGLLHWHCLSIAFVDEADCNAWVDYNVDGNTYRLSFRKYWDIPVDAQNRDYLLTHELLHLVLAPVMAVAEANCPPGLSTQLGYMEHAALAQLTRAMSGPSLVVRGLEDIEEVPPFPEGVAPSELENAKRYFGSTAPEGGGQATDGGPNPRYVAPEQRPFTAEQWERLNGAAVERPVPEAPLGTGASLAAPRWDRTIGVVEAQGSGSLSDDAARWFRGSGYEGREAG